MCRQIDSNTIINTEYTCMLRWALCMSCYEKYSVVFKFLDKYHLRALKTFLGCITTVSWADADNRLPIDEVKAILDVLAGKVCAGDPYIDKQTINNLQKHNQADRAFLKVVDMVGEEGCLSNLALCAWYEYNELCKKLDLSGLPTGCLLTTTETGRLHKVEEAVRKVTESFMHQGEKDAYNCYKKLLKACVFKDAKGKGVPKFKHTSKCTLCQGTKSKKEAMISSDDYGDVCQRDKPNYKESILNLRNMQKLVANIENMLIRSTEPDKPFLKRGLRYTEVEEAADVLSSFVFDLQSKSKVVVDRQSLFLPSASHFLSTHLSVLEHYRRLRPNDPHDHLLTNFMEMVEGRMAELGAEEEEQNQHQENNHVDETATSNQDSAKKKSTAKKSTNENKNSVLLNKDQNKESDSIKLMIRHDNNINESQRKNN